MSDDRNDSFIGRNERNQAEFGNADDVGRKDTQNTREDRAGEDEFADTTGGQAEGERGATDVEDEDEGTFGIDETLGRDAERAGTNPDRAEGGRDATGAGAGNDGAFGRNGE